MNWGKFFLGILGLSLLQAVGSSKASAGRASGLFTLAASAASRVMSPAVAAIPDLRNQTAGGPAAATPSAFVPSYTATGPPGYPTAPPPATPYYRPPGPTLNG